MSKLYNRKTKEYIDNTQYKGNYLEKVYSSKLLLKISTAKFVSKIYGIYNNSIFSKNKIKKFIIDNNIDMDKYEDKKYRSFNEFFIRKYKKINISKDGFISPCDGKLLVYKINKDLKVNIKGINYSVDEVLDDKNEDYKNGFLFVFRLSVDNYHRYHYIDDGTLIKTKRIKGKLHTVSDYSKKYKIYKENERIVNYLSTDHYGNIVYIEVGAMLIGKIVNNNKKKFKRGEEKGYFLPGASTVIVIANDIKVDKDILDNSKNNIETIVSVGERIGL